MDKALSSWTAGASTLGVTTSPKPSNAITGLLASLLSPLYKALLIGYVTTWAQLLAIDEQLDRKGAILHTADGKPYKHPLCSLRKSASEFLIKVCCEFGMTPASRSRVSGAAIPPTRKERPKYCGHADFPVDAG